MHTGGITPDEETTFTDIAGRVTQPYSHDFFNASALLLPVIALELIIRRYVKGRAQVLLAWRPNEPGYPWPNVWHCPGRIARVTHLGGFPQIIDELAKGEVGCPLVQCRRVGEDVVPELAGRKLTFRFVYLASVADDAQPNGEWYDVEELPDSTPPEHVKMITDMIFK